MRMLEMFKRPVVVDSKRDRLRAAILAKNTAQQEIDDAQSTLERLHAVIRAGDVAARAADDARRKETEARNAWVRGGCAYSAGRDLQSLTDAAAEAARAATRAALDADAVSKELGRVQAVVRSAQVDLESREDEITTAIGAIIADEAAPLLERFGRLAEQYRAMRAEVKTLQRVLDPPPFFNAEHVRSHAGARVITDALDRASIKSWHDEREAAQAHDFVEGASGRDEAMLDQLTSSWRSRAAKLRADTENSEK